MSPPTIGPAGAAGTVKSGMLIEGVGSMVGSGRFFLARGDVSSEGAPDGDGAAAGAVTVSVGCPATLPSQPHTRASRSASADTVGGLRICAPFRGCPMVPRR